MAVWYCGSTKWTAVTAWAAGTAYVVGDLRRQLATPTVGNERVFRCTTAGTSAAVDEPAWILTKGAVTEDNTVRWTEVTGNSTYGWTAAHARLSPAIDWCAAGDTVYVSNNHAQTDNAAITITSPGTAAAPCLILCVVDTATPPTTQATTATIVTNLSGAAALNFNGFAYCYGISFTYSGRGVGGWCNFVSTSPWWWRFDSCSLNEGSATFGSSVGVGNAAPSTADDQLLELINTSLTFKNTSSGIIARARMRWINSSGSGGTGIPTTLFKDNGACIAQVEVRGVDLSAWGSGTSIVEVGAPNASSYLFEGCKLGSSVSPTTGTPDGQGGVQAVFVNCDSADTNYRYQKTMFPGTVTQETTIVRTGGASDGTTAISRKMVSSADAKLIYALRDRSVRYWNEVTGSSVTVTVHCVTDGVTLTDAEAWVEVEYLGTSGYPVSSFVADRVADVLATPANQATSTETWTTTGLSSPVKQKFEVTFTPQMKGLIIARVFLAKASTTMYYCPKILSTSPRQYTTTDGVYYNEGAP